ncbi:MULTISPECIES: hypothetical protein [Stenotrophomonas]|uniref:hypothetical protein n=1 Tax=Stenotrophomonas TaxID=40323 RepID=UPI0015DDF52A|nr:hypothetical protein [Stenotrophomonas maltophilia]
MFEPVTCFQVVSSPSTLSRLPTSTQLTISVGVRSNWRLAAATAVLLWMISMASADLRRSVRRLISSSIVCGMGFFFGESNI